MIIKLSVSYPERGFGISRHHHHTHFQVLACWHSHYYCPCLAFGLRRAHRKAWLSRFGVAIAIGTVLGVSLLWSFLPDDWTMENDLLLHGGVSYLTIIIAQSARVSWWKPSLQLTVVTPHGSGQGWSSFLPPPGGVATTNIIIYLPRHIEQFLLGWVTRKGVIGTHTLASPHKGSSPPHQQ